jgi:hypothetical protein
MNKFKYNIRKHDDPLTGATLIDIGATYMNLIPLLYHRVLDVVSASNSFSLACYVYFFE